MKGAPAGPEAMRLDGLAVRVRTPFTVDRTTMICGRPCTTMDMMVNKRSRGSC